MKKYKMVVSYDGTDYQGWQAQAHGKSIQNVIEAALSNLLGYKTCLHGSSRTDAGVHALGQVAHFTSGLALSPDFITHSLNEILPSDIRILGIWNVPFDFHAQYSCKWKEYYYCIHLDPAPHPLRRKYAFHFPFYLNQDLLRACFPFFIGSKEFIAFSNKSKGAYPYTTGIRTLFDLKLCQEEGGIRLEFKGNGFLYKMVRNITATLIAVSSGRLPLLEIENIFKTKDRKQVPPPAPPQGLFLKEIHYEDPLRA